MGRGKGHVTPPSGPGLGAPASEEKPGEHSPLDTVTLSSQQQQISAITDLVRSLATQLQSNQRSAVPVDLPGTSLFVETIYTAMALVKLHPDYMLLKTKFMTDALPASEVLADHVTSHYDLSRALLQRTLLTRPGHPAKDCFMTNNEKREAFLKKASSSAKAAILKRLANYKHGSKHGKLPVPGEHLNAAAGQSELCPGLEDSGEVLFALSGAGQSGVHPGLEDTGESLHALRETEHSDLHSGLAESGDWTVAARGAVSRWNHKHPGYHYLSGSLPYPTPYQLCLGKGFSQPIRVDLPFSGLTIFNYYSVLDGVYEPAVTVSAAACEGAVGCEHTICKPRAETSSAQRPPCRPKKKHHCYVPSKHTSLLNRHNPIKVKPVHDCWVYIDTITAFFPHKACLERTPSVWEAGRGQHLDGQHMEKLLQLEHAMVRTSLEDLQDWASGLGQTTRALIRAVESYGTLIFGITDDGPYSDHFGSTHGSYSDSDSDYGDDPEDRDGFGSMPDLASSDSGDGPADQDDSGSMPDLASSSDSNSGHEDGDGYHPCDNWASGVFTSCMSDSGGYMPDLGSASDSDSDEMSDSCESIPDLDSGSDSDDDVDPLPTNGWACGDHFGGNFGGSIPNLDSGSDSDDHVDPLPSDTRACGVSRAPEAGHVDMARGVHAGRTRACSTVGKSAVLDSGATKHIFNSVAVFNKDCDTKACETFKLFASENNHSLDIYRTLSDTCFIKDWAGRHFYGNPPFDHDIILNCLQKTLADFDRDPANTKFMFMLPKWVTASWWHLTTHFIIIHEYPAGAKISFAPMASCYNVANLHWSPVEKIESGLRTRNGQW
ncbi:hypothetical protein CYMTET_52018 [Cymbomonas tetramitiformis]|uniref:Uncharacterized protein n=1 Tax=Cymbomonas tetramitiformis TaxID=36881 RepID=A0AAE0BJV6_9CHLO|nr:hypothetical protein CYMTET_52018 [Cymbomonas tetramitiformis]